MAFLYYKNNNVYYLDNINNITPQNQLSYTLCDINYNPLITSSLPMACHGLFDRTNITDFNNSYSFSNNSDISWFFNQCHNLRSITINEQDFGQISRLDSFINNSCNTSQFAHFINKCNNLSSVNFSQTDFKETNNFELMFYKCPQINNVKFDGIIANNTESFSNIFDTESNSIKTLSFIDADINKTRYFHNLIGVQTIILNGAKINEVTTITEMFKNCNELTTIEANEIQMNKLSIASNFIVNCRNVQTINFNKATLGDKISLNLTNMFSNLTNLKQLGFTETNFDKVSNINKFINTCNTLISIDFSACNINGENLQLTDMFYNCNNLQIINFSKATMQNIISISNFITNCPSINTINLENTKLVNLDSFENAFNNLNSLNSILFNGIITKDILSTANMFKNCSSIVDIDLSSIVTNVTKCNSMFDSCSQIENINLNNFKIQEKADITNMFNQCTKLKNVSIINCDDTTKEFIKQAIKDANLTAQVTIVES